MRKWVLFCVIAFVVVVAIATLILATFNRSKDEVPAEVAELSDTWQTINHPTYGVSFGAPVDWKIKVFESGMGYVSGFFNGDTTAVYFDLNMKKDLDSNPSIENLLERISPYVGGEVNQGGLRGISYVGKVAGEGDFDNNIKSEDVDESYMSGRYFIINGGILKAECKAMGADYVIYISECDKVLSSIRKI